MADEALLEVPTETEVPSIETEVPSTETTGAEGETTTTETETEGSGEALRGSALWRDVKTATQAGKPLTPKQLSALNKVIHGHSAFESKYPDGLSAIEGTMSAVKQLADDESVPIEKVIEETLQERNYFRELDGLFTAGKPEFVQKMAEASPEAFQNIAPAVFRKYAEVNPEGYSAYVAQAVQSHMNDAGVPLQFRILQAFLPQLPVGPAKEQVIDAVNSIYDWSESLKALAAKKIEQKAIPQTESPKNGPDQLPEREQSLTRREWNASIRNEGINLVRSEATKLAGKAPLTEKEHQTVLAKVSEELEARLTADRRYGEAMRQYLQAGNRNSYIQRIQSERKKLIPGAVRRAVDDVVQARPKAAPKEAAKPGTPAAKPGMKPVQGAVQFRRIAGHPKTIQGMSPVDHRLTTHPMLEKRQAILMDGSKVMWGPVARA